MTFNMNYRGYVLITYMTGRTEIYSPQIPKPHKEGDALQFTGGEYLTVAGSTNEAETLIDQWLTAP